MPTSGGDPTLVLRNAAHPRYLADGRRFAFIEPEDCDWSNDAISIADGGARPMLVDTAGEERTRVDARVYWFNDMDYHGVLADPYFRYSVRVDGTFRPGFAEALRDRVARGL